LAGQEHGRTIPLTDLVISVSGQHYARWHRVNLCDQSILQRFSNLVESLVYGRDLILKGIDLRARCRVEDADRRATT
jgi:hypothetical protein